MVTLLNPEKSYDSVDISYRLSSGGSPYRFEVIVNLGGVLARFTGLDMNTMRGLHREIGKAIREATDNRRDMVERGLLW